LANDDPHGHALALVNIANTSLEAAMQRPTSADLRTLQAQAKQAVAAAQEIGSVRLSVLAQRLLAELTALTDPEASIALTHQCEKSARAAQLLWYEAECLWVRAVALAATDPTLAQNAIEKAVSLMQRAAGGEPRQLAFAWRNRMRVSVEVKPVKEAFAEGLQALSVFEALRGLQPNYQTRQAAFSVWARDYRWLAGIRLQGDFANAEADALATMERMRSRSLLEALHMGSRKPPEQMSRIRDEISEINKTLMEATTPTQAAPLLLQLAALEQDELELQTDTIRQLPAAPALADLQASLQADEVLLSYQTSPWTSPFERQPGGTWVLAISATLIQAVRLPEPEEIIRMKQLLRGLRFQQRAYQSVARIAYQRLVQPALQGLADVTRLTVIPDGPLSTFPFATVIPAAEQALAVTIAPSAALWQMWRSRDAARAAGRPLVIANPQIDNAMSTEQPWIGEAVSLSNLPSTEEEAQTIQQLFPEGKIWLRTQSTEAALRQTALDNFDMLHIAAHTVLNHRFPDRSALILGAGAESEDGLLQAREIAALNLEAKLVVLASCQSAGGREVGGEGVIGLSRAFLVAGADAVLASLWPIRDDHAATFFKHFYQNLAQEMPVRKALHLAQATLRDAKFPMEAWGGYVLIGDGRWRVAPQSQGYNYFWLLGVLCLAMLLPMLGWYLQRGGQR
ncbi:MAG: CHAT domain-containing protein, partial [Pseudomonadota bacterium]